MLGLRLPERTGGRHLRHNFSRPQARGFDIRNGVVRRLLLTLICEENCRTVAGPDVVALTVLRRRIMDLKEKLEQPPVADLLWIENDLDRLGVGAVIAVRGV